jgi:hypothetical protein
MRQLKLAGAGCDAWGVTDFEQFAADWYEGWNNHDLDAILEHYAEDIAFTSPFVARLAGGDGTLHGRDELRRYFATAFERFPDLHFEPIAVATGVDSVVLHYRSVQGLLAAEMMILNDEGKVARVYAHYAQP